MTTDIKATIATLDYPARSALVQRLETAYNETRRAVVRAEKAWARCPDEEVGERHATLLKARSAARLADQEFTAALNACDELSPPHPNPFLLGVPAEDLGLLDDEELSL